MKGKISAGIFKVMALVIALAVGGGYIAWRQVEAEKAKVSDIAGGEDLLKDSGVSSEQAPLLPGSKSISMPLFTKDQIKQLPLPDKGAGARKSLPETLK